MKIKSLWILPAFIASAFGVVLGLLLSYSKHSEFSNQHEQFSPFGIHVENQNHRISQLPAEMTWHAISLVIICASVASCLYLAKTLHDEIDDQ